MMSYLHNFGNTHISKKLKLGNKLLLGFVLFLQIGFCGIGFAENNADLNANMNTDATTQYDNQVTENNNQGAAKYKVHIDSFKEGGEDITGEDGIDLITKYIAFFYKAAAGIIGLICVLIVAISGVQISLGGLSPEGVNQAKDRIIQALLSMALLFSSAAILKAINGGFFT